jgi:hypothetical protein
MLFLLLVSVGLLFICLSGLSFLALLDNGIKKTLESLVKEIIFADASQGIKTVSNYEPTIHEPKVIIEDDMANDDDAAPLQWNPQLITEQLRRIRNNPALLQYFFDSVKERLILGQDYRTSNSRIKFLQNQISELKIAKDYLTALDDLSFHKIQQEIRKRELELKKEDLESRRKAQQELDELKLERDKLQIKVEVAQLTKQINEIENPPEPPPKG